MAKKYGLCFIEQNKEVKKMVRKIKKRTSLLSKKRGLGEKPLKARALIDHRR